MWFSKKKLKALPQPALEEVAAYIDYISFKFSTERKSVGVKNKRKGFGCLKDIPCKMAPNFDESLAEFEEYM